MEPSIYWYDFETTGTDPARDRAIQFAGVRTDLDLKQIDEPLNLFCYPGNDIIPEPEAIAVTGIRLSHLVSDGMRETDFVARIHEEFSRPGTCVAGFNSIRFDDEFTRNTLYRNFLDPYAREWQGGNSRWDIIDFVRMAHALRPEGINWPHNEEGNPSFRLEELTEANGIAHADAHDAVSDVLATIELLRRVRAAQPRLYQYLFNLRRKKEVIAQLYPLGKAAVIHVSSMYAAARNCIAVVLPLASHPTNTNGVICYDLAVDPSELLECGVEELRRRIFSRSDELEEGTERIALKTIHVNRCPAVAPLATLQPNDALRLDIDLELCEQNKVRLQQASGVVEKIQDAFAQSNFPPVDDPDLMLYQGDFFSNTDRAQMGALRELGAADLGSIKDGFDDPRVPEMVFRYRARNYPDTLTDQEMAEWEAYRRDVSNDGERVREALSKIDTLEAEHGENESLSDLRAYLVHAWEGIA